MSNGSDIVFLFNERPLPKAEAVKHPIIVAGVTFPSRDVALVFDSENSFQSWAQETRHARLILETMRKIEEARQFEGGDLSALTERQKLLVERTIEDLKSLGNKTGLDMGSEEFFLRATSSTPALERPIFDPLTLCDSPGSSCAVPGRDWLPLGGGGWPDLRWFPYYRSGNWNDRARSFRVSGFALLYEHIWWKGRSVRLVGFPIWAGDLANWGFDSIASSAWVA